MNCTPKPQFKSKVSRGRRAFQETTTLRGKHSKAWKERKAGGMGKRERESCVEGMLSNSSGKQKDPKGFLGLIHKLLILIS